MDLQGIYIRSHQERNDPDKHIAYAVEVHGRNGRTWTVWRRYSEFEGLSKEMEQELAVSKLNRSSAWSIPSLPPKRQALGSVILQPWKGVSGNKDDHFLQDRQGGLERFLRGILASRDDTAQACRETRAWRTFLGAPATSSAPSAGKEDTFTAASWLDEYHTLENQAKEIQSSMHKRDRLLERGDTTAAHQASVDAKRLLAKQTSSLSVLASALDYLAKGGLSEGELRRRLDMITKMQDRTMLMGQMASASTARASTSRQAAPAASVSRDALLGSQSSGKPVTRVLGRAAGPAPETEETRALDNTGLLQLQYQTIDQQDDRLNSLTSVIRRQRELAIAIGVELEEQNELLSGLTDDVDRTGGKLSNAKKQIRRLE